MREVLGENNEMSEMGNNEMENYNMSQTENTQLDDDDEDKDDDFPIPMNLRKNVPETSHAAHRESGEFIMSQKHKGRRNKTSIPGPRTRASYQEQMRIQQTQSQSRQSQSGRRAWV